MQTPQRLRKLLTTADLRRAVAVCLDDLHGVIQCLSGDDPETIEFSTLNHAWQRYYITSFGRFDSLLRTYVDNGGMQYAAFLPVSISHHNLHRLMEVLRTEIGTETLGATRIPERIQDLFEVFRRLESLLITTCADGTDTTHPPGDDNAT